jgi:hypothetical protein
MTIAMCYLTREGVVLGADSTASTAGSGFHYYNHNQKLFELGDGSTFGALTWGMGGLTEVSHRTLLANLADDLGDNPPASMQDVADRWAALFWQAYDASDLVGAFRNLSAKSAHDPNANPDPNMRTLEEDHAHRLLGGGLVVGFCIAGYSPPDRTPHAFEITFEPDQGAPAPVEIPLGEYRFWGAPNMIARLINGFDWEIREAILNSGKWTGTEDELDAILFQQFLAHHVLPIRDAVDFVHACIYSTIKALKFSNFSQICGGPIEIATITTDRLFRWVRHKPWDAALTEGDRP